MWQEMTSGGSSSIVYGTVSNQSTTGGSFSVSTGLSSLSRFIIWGRNTNGTAVIIYDKDVIGSNKFSSANIQGGAVAQKPNGTIGDDSNNYYPSITSLSGGTVTIKNSKTTSNIFGTNIQWYAES